MPTISERLRDLGDASETNALDFAEAANTIDALVATLERLTRVARVELATTRPDVIEQADAVLALARRRDKE